MEGTGFRIRTKKSLEMVIFGVLISCMVAAVLFGLRTDFSGQVSAYAKEAAEASGVLEIPSIALLAPVSKAELSGRTLSVPDYIVGAYQTYEDKTLLMGHSSTVFSKLEEVKIGDEIIHNGRKYTVASREIKPKSEISMREILDEGDRPMLVLMTCFGEHVSGRDYSHRLIINAVVSGE